MVLMGQASLTGVRPTGAAVFRPAIAPENDLDRDAGQYYLCYPATFFTSGNSEMATPLLNKT